MTAKPSRPLSGGTDPNPGFSVGIMGSFERIRAVFTSPAANHRLVIRQMIAATLALLLAYSVGVSGGMVTVIGVLFMPSIPHSIFLACSRLVFSVVGCGMGWILGMQFGETPLVLITLLATNALIFYYLMAKGLPVFIMILMGLMPIGFAWLVISGKSSVVAQEILIELLCGVFAMEVVSLLWPDRALDKLRANVGGAMCRFSHEYQQMFDGTGSKSVIRPKHWRASTNTAFNTSMLFARSEVGSHDRELNRLVSIVDQIRHVLPWPDILYLFLSGGKYDKWATELSTERSDLHRCIQTTTLELGTAINQRGTAVSLDAARESMDRLEAASGDWVKRNRDTLDLEQISIFYARCDLGHEMNNRFERINSTLIERFRQRGASLKNIPPTVFSNVKKGFDSAAALFSVKATLSVFISFLIGLIYLDWSGCIILILLSGFLAPLSFGGLTVTFIDRIVGLIIAAFVALMCIMLLLPDIDDVGVFLLLLCFVTYPFWLLATNPLTAGLGLSALMASFYILTSPFAPSASLAPVETRVIAVGGATLVSYLVFLLFMPVTALQIVTVRIDELLNSIARIAAFYPSRDAEAVTNEDDLRVLAHESVRALANFDQLVHDLRSELSPHGRYARIRAELLNEFSVLVPLIVNCVNVGIRIPSTETSQFIELRLAMKHAVTDFFGDLSDYSSGPRAGSFSLEPGLLKCIEAHEKLGDHLEREGYADRAIVGDDQDARVALIYHAYHRIIIRRLRVIRRLMVIRLEESRRVRPQKVARTA